MISIMKDGKTQYRASVCTLTTAIHHARCALDEVENGETDCARDHARMAKEALQRFLDYSPN